MANKEKILQLHSEWKTCQEIRDILGNSLTTIRKYIKEAGYTTNSKIARADKEILDKINELLDLGKTNKEIASELGISPTTARKYTTELLNKDTNNIKTKSIISKDLELTDE